MQGVPYCLTTVLLAQQSFPGRGHRGYHLRRALSAPKVYSCLFIFRFLIKWFDTWLFYVSVQKYFIHILTWNQNLTLPPLSLFFIFLLLPVLNPSELDEIVAVMQSKKGISLTSSWCFPVLLKLLSTSNIQRFPVQLIICCYLSDIPLQWNDMSTFIHWWPSLFFFWNIHLWSPVAQQNAD